MIDALALDAPRTAKAAPETMLRSFMTTNPPSSESGKGALRQYFSLCNTQAQA
jgi:hypothetical protein